MKKILLTLLAVALSASLMSAGSTANADDLDLSDCKNLVTYIEKTGEDSVNKSFCADDTELTVVCENDIYVLNANSQIAVSGSATGASNVTSGNATTGNASNSNSTIVKIGSSCGPEEETPEVPVTPETPVTPAGGAGEAKPVVAKLPDTAANSTLQTVVASIVAVAVALVASRFAVAAYRRATLK